MGDTLGGRVAFDRVNGISDGITLQNYLSVDVEFVVTDAYPASDGFSVLESGVLKIGESKFIECDMTKCIPHGKFNMLGMGLEWSEVVVLVGEDDKWGGVSDDRSMGSSSAGGGGGEELTADKSTR